LQGKLESKFDDVLDIKIAENLKSNILALQKENKAAFENTLSKENNKEILGEMNIETIKKDNPMETKDVFFSSQNLEENVKENIVAETETKGEENLFEEDLDEKSAELNEIREEQLFTNSKIKTNFEGKIEEIQKKEIEIPKDEIIKQVLDKGKAVVDENKSEIRIKLKPEILGEVLLKVEVEKGVVVAKAIVDNYRVKELLETNIYQLKEGLEKQGLDIKTFEVQVGTNSNFENEKREKYSSNDKNKKIKIKKLDLNTLNTYEKNIIFDNENIIKEGSLDLMA
jgi:flagellar hook-length control protein FliK